VCESSPNLKFIFAYNEILDYEKSRHSYFNSSNSLYIPCGLPDSFFLKHENTYNSIYNKFVFVCQNINTSDYFTKVYDSFNSLLHYSQFDFIILGKNNDSMIGRDERLRNNLSDDDFFQEAVNELSCF
jgi:hypothetical protein